MIKKFCSKFLAMTFCLCMVAFTGKTKADDGPTLAGTINAFAEGGGTGGALNAVWNASTLTVTVTNTGGTPIIDATSGLTLDIDPNITVLWKASLTAAIPSGTLIDLIGNGKFLIEGGTLCNTITSGATRTIRNNYGTLEITSGTVEKMGNGITIQNISTGNINISGGTVSIATSTAISIGGGTVTISEEDPNIPTLITSAATGTTVGAISFPPASSNGKVIITGGTVENTGDDVNARAIYSNSASSTIEIWGGTVQATSGRAIYNENTGEVTISGGTVQATTGEAIYNLSTGAVTISGGTVQVTSGRAINNGFTGEVAISGGTVQGTTTGEAIRNAFTGTVAISGGIVQSGTGYAIQNANRGIIIISEADQTIPTVISSAGTGYAAIRLANNSTDTSSRVIITGGTVKNAANGNYDYAIINYSPGAIEISGGIIKATGMTINNQSTGAINISGGTVQSATGRAIHNESTAAITISGGMVQTTSNYAVSFADATANLTINGTATLFAYGEEIDDVIFHNGTYSIDDDAVVIAWDETAGETSYIIGTDSDLVSIPANCATWNLVEQLSGITYSNGLNEGFIEIADIMILFPPVIITEELPIGMVGAAYSETLLAEGTQPIYWSVVNGNLPVSLNLNFETGELTGMPFAAGSFTFTVKAQNEFAEDTKEFTIMIGAFPVIITENLPIGMVGLAYSETLLAEGTQPISWSVEGGNLPVGLNLNAETGEISGTPNAAGTFTFSVKAQNEFAEDTKEFTIIIHKGEGAIVATPVLESKTDVTITIVAVTPPTNGQTVEYSINTINSVPSGVWQVDLTFAGLTENTVYYIFARSAENDNYNAGEASTALEVTTDVTIIAPTIITETLPDGTIGEPYNVLLEATGDQPILWEIISGALPTNLDLNLESGALTGTPFVEGTYTFNVRAFNVVGEDTKVLSLKINSVGINMAETGTLQVYPNPTTGKFSVVGANNIRPNENNIRPIEIFDAAGRLVYREPCTMNRTPVKIDISHLPNGIYFVKIGNETIKIVKK